MLRDYIDFLVREEYLRLTEEYRTLVLGEKAQEVLFRGEAVTMPLRLPSVSEAEDAPEEKPMRKEKAVFGDMSDVPDALMTMLKTVRRRFAEEEGVPLYVVFSNATLADMARRCPHTMEEFLEVSGVGAVKAERYGAAFLEAIAAYGG